MAIVAKTTRVGSCHRMLLLAVLLTAVPPSVLADSGCVATVHPLATDAGLAVLGRGGNAVDAAVAAALTLGVVDTTNSGVGGGCFILLRRADGSLAVIDGRETAAGKAHRDLYVRNGELQPKLAQRGPLAVAVPGALAAYEDAVRNFGRLSLAELLMPAAEIAERGFAVDALNARRFKAAAKDFADDPGCRTAFLHADGSPLGEGEVLKQPDLARTYRAVAQQGINWFYRGPFAQSLGAWMASHGGIISADDLAAYRARRRDPLVGTYREWTLVSMPPPSSGGVHVLQIMNILEHFDLKELRDRDTAVFYHVVAEAMKLAFADRAYWLGDPDFVRVPKGLVDKKYAAELAKRIRLDAVAKVDGPGQPPGWRDDYFGKNTTHIAAADSEGNWVALTTTVNLGFGARVMVPGTGVILNDEMDDFSISPGVPSATGLVGAEANAIAPHKRPLSSMSPTIVLRQGQPIFTVGAAGGPKIITQVVQALIHHLDLGMTPGEALGVKRIHHQWSPNKLFLEKGFDPAVVQRLNALGHETAVSGSAGVTQAIQRTSDGLWVGAFDPRVPGKAASR